MLRNALRLFTARFLRRKYWLRAESASGCYSVAWMDAPWRALPTGIPKSSEEAEKLNQVLKDYLFAIENSILKDFKRKVYARKREDWFELFLVTFIFQVVLSENLEMSFHSKVDGFDDTFELPWSTFGGLRSYSSRKIASYFLAINGTDPFKTNQGSGKKAVHWNGFGVVEQDYLDQCSAMLKDSMLKKDDLGSRRSRSTGHDGSPGSWWQWVVETVLGKDLVD